VDALIKALFRETDARARVWILDSLRAIAREDVGSDAEAWFAWWKRRKDDAAFQPPADVPAEKKEFAGVPLEVVTVPARRGAGESENVRRPELFVLSPYGWNHAWFGPHLDALKDVFTVTTIRLPSLKELTGLSGYGNGIGTYPLARLAKAFDALREARGVEEVVVLAEGATCWVAEAYAVLAPKRVRGLILIDGWLDAPAYASALQRWSVSPDADEAWMAKSLLGVASAARDRDEDRRMARIALTHRLTDRSDLLGHHLWTRARDPQGFATMPPLEFTRRTRIPVPALFLFPAASRLSGHHDAPRIREAFPNSIVAVVEESRGLAFVEQHDEFHRIVKGFVDRHRLAAEEPR
jgi:pimeloyl-ACP methyl ester carboxylesterase